MTPRRIRVLELRSVTGPGGGPEKTILLGAARADRSRFDIRVCYIRDERDRAFDLDARARQLGVDYVEVRERHSLDLGILSALVDIVRDGQVDIVHAHDYKTDAVALYLRRRTGVVPLATAHGWTGSSSRERRIYYPLDRWLLARFPRVIAVSSEIRQVLLDAGARPERVTVILNGIDPDAFRRGPNGARMRASLGIPVQAYVIGSVGRAERQKRFDLLLDAVAPLMASHPEIHLVIVGSGSLLDELRGQAATLGITGRCHFTGHRPDVSALHEAFDLFVQASDYEGTPNAVLEAMALETPLVATNVGGTGELAIDGHHAVLVPPGDREALAAAIAQAIADPAGCSVRARAARSRIEVELSFETRTRHLERVYAELVDA
jgi:glycosyltransferase involved in cell wall biosynthesis